VNVKNREENEKTINKVNETTPNAIKRDIVQKIPGLKCPKCESTNVEQETNEPAYCIDCKTVFAPNDMHEVAPPGWEGTVKAMKKHPEIKNPWALAWSMKNKGDKPHH
jgi:hypothetical protein